MVNFDRSCPEFDASANNFPVAEAEIEHQSLNQQFLLSITHENVLGIHPSQNNLLDEPSPLGLRLRKSPSLLNFIQTRLAQANDSSSASAVPSVTPELEENKSVKNSTSSAVKETIKAANFSAMLLRIGDWEFLPRFDGALVAKFYFANRKLIWEILQNGLKSKIEILWSDISSLKANLPSDGLGTLYITLQRRPRFFKEIDPVPKKHTSWEESSDFTGGKASIFRQHILLCPQGVLNKPYEKLIELNTGLNLASQQPDDFNQSPYFDDRAPFFENPNAPKVQELDPVGTAKRSSISALQVTPPTSSSLNFEEQNSVNLTPQYASPEAPPISEMDFRGSEINSIQREEGYQPQKNWEQLNALGINKPISRGDLVNHIGHCLCSKYALEGPDVFESIEQFLFSDTTLASNADKKKFTTRVNYLCCLIQDPSMGPMSDIGTQFEGLTESEKQQMRISRGCYFSDLLFSLQS